MPFEFDGQLNKIVTELGKDGLALNDQKNLKELTIKTLRAVE